MMNVLRFFTPSRIAIAGFLSRWLGLHPIVAWVMMAIDAALFGTEVLTGFADILVTFLVGLALIFPCALIQRFFCKDEWSVALLRGSIAGVLTAIPVPLYTIVRGIYGFSLLFPRLAEQLSLPKKPEGGR